MGSWAQWIQFCQTRIQPKKSTPSKREKQFSIQCERLRLRKILFILQLSFCLFQSPPHGCPTVTITSTVFLRSIGRYKDRDW